MSVRIDINKAQILRKVDRAWEAALPKLSEQILSDCNEYCPHDDGTLIDSSALASEMDKGKLVWQTPYARYLYYGMLMVAPNGSAWARSGEAKHLTNKKLVFHSARNLKATALWCEAAKRERRKDWERIARQFMKEHL